MGDVIDVVILGRKIPLKANGNEEYIRQVAEYVNEKMEEVAKAQKSLSALNVSILAALNIADDFFRTAGQKRAAFEKIDKQCVEIINLIDALL